MHKESWAYRGEGTHPGPAPSKDWTRRLSHPPAPALSPPTGLLQAGLCPSSFRLPSPPEGGYHRCWCGLADRRLEGPEPPRGGAETHPQLPGAPSRPWPCGPTAVSSLRGHEDTVGGRRPYMGCLGTVRSRERVGRGGGFRLRSGQDTAVRQ